MPGQPIAVLRNDELKAELADLELACDESLVKSRMLIQAQELAKLQVETADRGAGKEDCRTEDPRRLAHRVSSRGGTGLRPEP